MASRPVAHIAAEPADYRQHLRRKGLYPVVIERTEKRPGDLEFVWQGRECRAVKVAAIAGRTGE